MPRMIARCLVALVSVAVALDAGTHSRGSVGGDHARSLMQTWSKALDGSKETPIVRVVNLLNEMKTTLKTEMDEDEELFDKLACWCNNNQYDKDAAKTASENKIEQLEHSIEAGTARSAELNTKIKELEAEFAADKQALAEATALRQKQIQEFQGTETDSIQAIENLKAALVILSKHHEGAFPQFSALQTGKDMPWGESSLDHSFDDFMRHNGFDGSAATLGTSQGFLQNQGGAASDSSWSNHDTVAVQRALRSASAFVQAHHEQEYFPSYSSKSGEIVGVMKQLKEQMEGELGEAQRTEQKRAATFAALREAKTAEIEEGEKMSEQKEDELAKTDNDLAEAKEDLAAELAALSETEKFMKNLKETCAEADKNFQARKASRLDEIKAVSETIEILTADEARDASSGTYSFIQVRSTKLDQRRSAAALLLRRIAVKTSSPNLSALATTVELDAFTKVKKAIDDMIAMLNTQQADEVKKNDWCASQIQENEMTIMKTDDAKADLQAKIGELESTITTLAEDIAAAQASIADAQMNLQRASEDRKAENIDFQKTIADQTMTIEVLHKALDKLATFYDKENLMQTQSHGVQRRGAKQTPPVPQMEYKPNEGSTGVMSLIEKLIFEAKGLMADSKKSEGEAQAAYEAFVADTNNTVDNLAAEIVSKTKAKAKANKDKINAESDLGDTLDELEGLHKTGGDLHAECDYLSKNFQLRQEARGQEIEALQQAKQILNGASLN